MRKSIAAVAVLALFGATSACGQMHNEGAGPRVSRNYQVGNFQQIEVAGPYEVTVRTGTNPSVSAQGSENLLQKTIVEVRGDKLVIRPEEHHGFSWGWNNNGKADFTVTVPQLAGAAIKGSGDIHVDHVRGDRFEGAIGGSGGLNVDSIDVASLKLSIGGSGSVKAAAGKAQSAEYSIAGSGDIDAGSVQLQQAKVSIAGSGSVKAHATGSADVSIMGAGDVDVSGGAKCTVSKAGSGDVRCS
ncbi:MAG: head GIN domain-containing protein [Sphingomonas sp.]